MKKYLFVIVFLTFSDLLYSQSFIKVVVDHIKYELYTQYQGDYSPMDVGPATVIYNDEETSSGDLVIPESITYSFVWYNRFIGENQTITKSVPVTSIRSLAFENCIDLNSVYISKNVSYIDKDLFPGCDNLSSIIVNSENSKYDSRENCNAIIETNTNTLISGCKNSIVPSGVIKIGASAFHGCRNLTSFIIPSHVNNIDDNAFENCTGLTSIEVLSNLNSFGIAVFKGCTNLKEVIFNCERVTGLFYGITSIEQIVLKDGVKSIDGSAFFGCTALKSITIPNSVTSIGSCAFRGCDSLSSVIIPKSVSFMGEGAFCCSNLSDIYCDAKQIPDGFATAFNYCNTNDDAIKQMTLHVPVVAIEAYKQLNMGFKEILPIETDTYFNLTYYVDGNVYLTEQYRYGDMISPADNPSKKGMTFSGWSEIPATMPGKDIVVTGSFSWSRKTVDNVIYQVNDTINNYAIVIGNENAAGEIKICGTVDFDESYMVNAIADKVFYGCKDITKVCIPEGMTLIGVRAFANIDKLTDVTINAENVPETDRTAFENSYIDYVTLHVPYGSLQSYKTIGPWKDFKEVVAIEGSGPEVNEQCDIPSISFVDGKLLFDCETEDAECHFEITNEDVKKGIGREIELAAVYQISVFASKDGYKDSEIRTAMLYWINVDPTTMGLIKDELKINSNAILVQNNGGVVSISGVGDGADVIIYNISGQLIGQGKASGNRVEIETNLFGGDICIIKISERSVKYILK